MLIKISQPFAPYICLGLSFVKIETRDSIKSGANSSASSSNSNSNEEKNNLTLDVPMLDYDDDDNTCIEEDPKAILKKRDELASEEKKMGSSLSQSIEAHDKQPAAPVTPKRTIPSWMGGVGASSSSNSNANKKQDDEKSKKREREEESSSKKSELPKKIAKTVNFKEILQGVTICISGIENPESSNLRSEALNMGAKYANDWSKTCTHLSM